MWKNKAQGRQLFVGTYERDRKGERIFVLANPDRRITFESWQMAKKLGWKKL